MLVFIVMMLGVIIMNVGIFLIFVNGFKKKHSVCILRKTSVFFVHVDVYVIMAQF